MNMRTLIAAFALCLAVAAAAYWFGKRAASPPLEAENPPDMRALVAQEVDKVSKAVTLDKLDAYLDGLVAHAEQQGQATALDVEPGVQMIMTLTGDAEKLAEFTARMQAINGIQDSVLTVREAEFRLAQLSEQIAIAEPGSEQLNRLIGAYMNAAAYLEAEANVDAMIRLNEIVPGTGSLTGESSDPMRQVETHGAPAAEINQAALRTELQQLRQQIGNTADEQARNRLVEDYLDQAHRLGPEQSLDEIAKLQPFLPQSATEDSAALGEMPAMPQE